MHIRRREFIKLGGAGLLLAGFDLRTAFAAPQSAPSPRSPFYEQLASDEFPFPYDETVFECAERIANVRRSAGDPKTWLTDLNLLVRNGKTLDIKVLVADRSEDLPIPRETLSFTGVTGSLDTVLLGYDSPRLYYQVQYREGGSGAWKALSPRNFKLPNARLQSGGQVQAVFIGDDHTFDDADAVVTADLKTTKITGDFFCDFLRNMKTNANWRPSNALANMANGLSLIKTIRQILISEDPDLFVNMGDTTGIGAEYRWEAWGLPFKNLTNADYDYIARTLWLRMRRAYSGLTPNMPTLMVLGNHDGEEGYNPARFNANSWRKKYFPSPDAAAYPESGHPDGNYYALTRSGDENNGGGVQFIVLDVMGSMAAVPRKVEDWTLGVDQRKWLEGVLADSEHEYSFIFAHHVLGGWPAAPEENDPRTIAYGRGNLFTAKDYTGYGDPAKIEQIQISELARGARVRGFIYGHDHVFKATRIGDGKTLYDLYGVCTGSSKSVCETDWWNGPFWQKHYGSFSKNPPDFYGTYGFTRLTVTKDQAKFEFVPAGRGVLTNISSASVLGAVLSSAMLANPVPAIGVDKSSFVFQTNELSAAVPAQVIRIRNAGGRSLDFTVKPKQSWLKASPASGTSVGEWTDVTVSLASKTMTPGTYDGAVSIECAGAVNSPFQVAVQLVVQEAALPAPTDLTAERLKGPFSLSGSDTIRLAWKEDRLATAEVKMRISLVGATGGRTTVGEVKAGIGTFLYKKVRRDTEYRFAVCALDGRNREGALAFVTVPKAV
jgi:hypothetical protein